VPTRPPIAVLLPEEGESWTALLRRIQGSGGGVIVVLPGDDKTLLPDAEARDGFLSGCRDIGSRLRLATKDKELAESSRKRGIRIIDRSRNLRSALKDHPRAEEALRSFSPQVWKQQLTSKLQSMGVLSLPRLRIYALVAVSVILFAFVILRLLPSADVQVRPRDDFVSQTSNIFLVQSGAMLDIPARVRTMPLIPITVRAQRSITFDQISKEFIGTSASATMTVVNTTGEPYSFRKGTRLANEAGMIFKTTEPLIIPAKSEAHVRTKADDVDLYGEIIGERGNVPSGVRWNFLGLASEERILVYAENREPAHGGTTGYRMVLHNEDLEVARKKLESELLAMAKQLVDEERTLRNAQSPGRVLDLLYYPELTIIRYEDFVLPTAFLGEQIQSVPAEGAISYTVFAYDAQAILDLLKPEFDAHVRDGKELREETLNLQHLKVYVTPPWDDDLRWIKLTVDLTAVEQYVLDPLSPSGALFGKNVREKIVGLSKEDALRIIRNLPEVENVDIRLWPPWNSTLPSIPSHISITALPGTPSTIPAE
jgi:hypothetical protein